MWNFSEFLNNDEFPWICNVLRNIMWHTDIVSLLVLMVNSSRPPHIFSGWAAAYEAEKLSKGAQLKVQMYANSPVVQYCGFIPGEVTGPKGQPNYTFLAQTCYFLTFLQCLVTLIVANPVVIFPFSPFPPQFGVANCPILPLLSLLTPLTALGGCRQPLKSPMTATATVREGAQSSTPTLQIPPTTTVQATQPTSMKKDMNAHWFPTWKNSQKKFVRIKDQLISGIVACSMFW